MAARAKTHHFLPRLILRGFARDDRLATVELAGGRSYVQSVANAAAENNYNTVQLQDGTQSDVAERFIAKEIEGPAAKVLGRVAAGGWFTEPRERRVVARFLALQYVRVPWRRAQSDAMADQLMKLEMAAGGPNQLREVMESQAGRPVSDEEVAEAWEDLREFDDWKLALSREHHVVEGLNMAEEFAPGLDDLYDWSVMRWNRKCILTCDSPVLLLPHRDAKAWEGVGLFTAGTIWFPIDRCTALVLANRVDERGLDGAQLRPSAAAARRLNRLLVAAAFERIYHHPDDTLEALLGEGFELPGVREPGWDDDHSIKLRNALRSMGEWHFEHPDEPHPMSGKLPDADSGVAPWTASASD